MAFAMSGTATARYAIQSVSRFFGATAWIATGRKMVMNELKLWQACSCTGIEYELITLGGCSWWEPYRWAEEGEHEVD